MEGKEHELWVQALDTRFAELHRHIQTDTKELCRLATILEARCDALEERLRLAPEEMADRVAALSVQTFSQFLLLALVGFCAYRGVTALFGPDAPWYVWAVGLILYQAAVISWGAKAKAKALAAAQWRNRLQDGVG
jgi:hypothetical protein